MSTSFVLTLTIVAIHAFESMAQMETIPIRMYPKDYHELVARESALELSYMPDDEQRSFWRKKSRQYFRASRSCVEVDESNPCIMPFLLCDSTPHMSAYRRREILYEEGLSRTPPTKIDQVVIESTPLYNSDEKTCFVSSMTPKIARRVALQSCPDDDDYCLIHSKVPMMKLSLGTVERVELNTVGEDAFVRLRAELSPYHKEIKDLISLEEIVKETIDGGLDEERCLIELEDTFPSTGKTLDCTHSLKMSEIEFEWTDFTSSAVFYLTPENEEGDEYFKGKVLRFIAGLATRPEFSSLEESTETYYFY